ncbi:MAG: TorF family putative porin [Steroidobacter sp.]
MATQRSLSIGVWCIVLHSTLSPMQAARADERWSGSIGAATDYIYRGVTQTNGEAAVQGGLFAQSRNGWSAGAWGSTVDLNRDGRRGYEIDLHASRAWVLGSDWIATLGVTRYEHLNDDGLVDYDRDELNASLSFQQRVTATISWSPNTTRYWHMPVRGQATAYELTFVQPLGPRWSLFAGAGHYDLRDLVDDGYSYWSAGVTFSWASLQIDAAHIGADATAERLFGAEANSSRWTGALSVRF